MIVSKGSRLASLALLAVFVLLSAAWAEPTGHVMVPMTDGTGLWTDYYLPDNGGPAFPVLVTRSTYGRGNRDGVKKYLERGFACVVQDIRGFGDSKGKKDVFFTDGWREGLTDGADTIAWVKQQPWCDGKVGTFGGSALGITQVLLAPPTEGLSAQSIVVATSDFYDYLSYQGGVWRKNLCEGWLNMLQLGNTMDSWKSHPTHDSFWSYYDVEDQAPKITAPAIHSGGWYDIFQQGTINNFMTRQYKGGQGAKGNQRLIIGPHAHGKYNDEAALKLPEDNEALRLSHHERAFFSCWLKGESTGIEKLPPVYYYVIGDDTDADSPGMEWRTANDWPPFPAESTAYYLADGGLLTTDESTASATASFTYDPADPFPTFGGQNLILPKGPFDQRTINEGRSDLLKFASEPLSEPMEITGHVSARLFVSTDAPDTDFTVKLIDIYPKGDDREILMLDNIQRVKFRNGCDAPAPLLTSNEDVVEVEIDLWSISWVFNTGHRIGLQVSSSNYPRFEKNPNTGDDFPTADNMRVAHNTVHMGSSHPSAVVLPVRPKGVDTPLAQYLNPEDVPGDGERASGDKPVPRRFRRLGK